MRGLSALIITATLALAAPAFLAGPAGAHDDHGRRDAGRHDHGRYKYEYDDGTCKVEVKRGRHGYKEERKCRYDRYGRKHHKYHGRSHHEHGGYAARHRDHRGWHRDRWRDRRHHDRYHHRHRHDRPRGDLHSGYRRPAPAYGGAIFLDGGGLACNREVVGQLIGGAVGALAASNIGSGSGQLYAIAGGALLGVLAGGEVGRHMDRVDRGCVHQALEHVPSGRAVAWNDPDAGAHYETTPTRTYQTTSGRYCREYTTTATVGGRTQQIYGTACRQPDGAWELVD